jgi:hypothetical protein
MKTSTNFYKIKTLSNEFPQMKEVFYSFSYEIFQFLEKSDLTNLKLTNKIFWDICDCHELFSDSIKSLDKIFLNSLEINNLKNEDGVNKQVEKKSKLKEKFNFNRSMNEFYKGTEKYKTRIESGKRRKKI